MKRIFIIVFASYLSFSTLVFANSISPLDNAIAALESGQTGKALQLFEKQKHNPRALVYLAKINIAIDLDDAEDWIEKAVDIIPNDGEAHYLRGVIMGQQASGSIFSALGYAKKSLTSFNKAVELEPDSIVYQNALMQFHVSAPSIAGGDLEIAKAQVEKIKMLDQKVGLKAEIQYEQGQGNDKKVDSLLEQAKQTYSKLPEPFLLAGMIQQQRKNYPAAFEELSMAISKNAETEESIVARYKALYQLGKTSILAKSNFDAGTQALNEYISEAPNLSGMSPKRWAEFRLANIMALNSQKSEAKVIYQRLAKGDDKELARQAKKAAKKI
jgi:tetratricopeptide (TPR) repeat protein|tara:strand:- start:114 stop:1097 length:984 start_codon:yes stop_codon:yes gene_type:complete